jgi:hypothetical protein
VIAMWAEIASARSGGPQISHLAAMCLFALLISIAIAGLTKRTALERAKYSASCFLKFLAAAIAIGWLMYPFSH